MAVGFSAGGAVGRDGAEAQIWVCRTQTQARHRCACPVRTCPGRACPCRTGTRPEQELADMGRAARDSWRQTAHQGLRLAGGEIYRDIAHLAPARSRAAVRSPQPAGGRKNNSSGTINTMSTTRIDAPTRRSLTRRSIELISLERKCAGALQYIREAPPVAASRAPRANRAPAPPYGRSRRPRCDPHPLPRPTPPHSPKRRGCPAGGDRRTRPCLGHHSLRQRRAAAAPVAVGRRHTTRHQTQSLQFQRTPPRHPYPPGDSTHCAGPPTAGRPRANCAPTLRAASGYAPHPVSRWAPPAVPAR